MIAVARNRDGSLVQVAKDYGVSTMCLLRWSIIAVVEDEVRSGITIAETAETAETAEISGSKNGKDCWNKKSRF